MKSLALILGLLAAVQALPAKGPTPLNVHMPVIEGAPVPIPPKIVGGQAAVLGDLPHQAAIVLDVGASFCGGSLIATDWILTAAHCAEGMTSFEVILGRIRFMDPTVGVDVVTTEKYVPIDYDPVAKINDIALLHLPRNVTLTKTIWPVALADASNSFAGETAVMSGFGWTTENGVISPDLMFVLLPVISNDDCAPAYNPGLIISSHICTSGAGGRGPCNHDSGGALVIYRNGSGFTQIGIFSFYHNTGCTTGHPSVYTRVTSFRGWIREISGV